MNKISVVSGMLFILGLLHLAEEIYLSFFATSGIGVITAIAVICASIYFGIETWEADKAKREKKKDRERRYRKECKINLYAEITFWMVTLFACCILLIDLGLGIYTTLKYDAFPSGNFCSTDIYWVIFPVIMISCYLAARRPKHIKVQF